MKKQIFMSGIMSCFLLLGSSACETNEFLENESEADFEDRALEPTVYQAESATAKSGCSVATNHAGFTGTGFMDYGANGTWIEWNNVNAAVAGNYKLTFRYAVASGSRQCAVSINAASVGNVPFAATSAWTTWGTVSIIQPLKAGNNVIRVLANTSSGGPNLDKLELLADDLCPGDPNKTVPGQCGCGVPEGSCGGASNCVEVAENQTASLACPAGQTIASLSFASYGTPTGACPGGFALSSCHAASSLDKVKASCLAKPSCSVVAGNGVFGDPCGGTFKKLAIVYACGNIPDACPNDPNKVEPGLCGCGVPEGTCTLLPLAPFDANVSDLSGPKSWASSYGKTPELIVASNGSQLDVLAQDYDATTSHKAVLIHIAPSGSSYAATEVQTSLPMLDRIMGLAVDSAGNRYYATGVEEASVVNATYPALNTYRPNIVRVVKVDPSGRVLFNIDLDIARRDFKSTAEPIINPMVAATSRLAVGGNELALVHGINTAPDANLGGTRHQKALSTRLDATTGAVTRVSSIWVSHSFDQRLLYDGSGLVELHLGDAYPRQIAMGKNHTSYPLFHIKGPLGANVTRTRLGDLARIEGDPTYGYLALFSTENTPDTADVISGPRNLAMVRIHATDSTLDPTLPNTLTVNSSGKDQTNRLRWLTSYTSASGLHAERPKLVAIGNRKYVVLWEEWTVSGFNGVFGMVIDDKGAALVASKLITKEHHLERGDDAFVLSGKAGWMTGTASTKKLQLHLVNASLGYEKLIF
ncbi:MAG: carbohydrate-binding protein [Myxococcota bacterium]|nr:carbohydrate-binding protein [Myxococcota bacterium]